MKNKIIKFSCLIIYLLCVIVLIVESSMDGPSSAGQSNAVGGIIADNINELKGDTTKIIEPTKLEITNKIDKAFVNDTYTLTTTTYPENTSYKSNIYESSNPSIATISSTGKIKFLKDGEVTITVNNSKYPQIKDSFKVIVSNVEAENFNIKITKNKIEIKPENNIYVLELGTNYQIVTEVKPTNTTNKKTTFTINTSEYLSVTNKGTITPLKNSNGISTKVTIKIGNITKQIEIIIRPQNIINIENISAKNDTLYVNEIKYPKIIYTPSKTSFKDYSLSTDSDILELINDNKAYKALKEGTAVVTITSKNNNKIASTFTITIKPQVKLEDFIIPTTLDLVVGEEKQLEPLLIPSYANPNFNYSSNSDIISVSNEGLITALKEGTTILTISSNEITKQITINITKKIDSNITSFELNKDILILNSNTNYNLNELLFIANIDTKDNSPITDLTLEFKNSSINAVNEGIFNTNILGYSTIDVIHKQSKQTKTITIIVLNHYDITIANKTNSFDLNVNNNLKFTIEDNDNNQNYLVQLENNKIALLSNEDNIYNLKAIASGKTNLIITPILNGKIIKEAQNKIPINISHIYTNTFDIEIIDTKKDELIDLGNEIKIYLNDKIKITSLIDENATIFQITYSSSNEDILTIDGNGNLILNDIGKATITITEVFSNKKISFTLLVNNYYKLKDEKIILTGSTTGYNEEKNIYYITNGHSGKIDLNFDENSTYTIVNYSSDNEKVLIVGKDGTITPIKAGKAKITLICYDGINEKIEITITMEVKSQAYIKDMDSFLYIIRKSLGHFGAFLVLGIFSTLTFMLFLPNKKLLFAIPINFVQGFGVAALTEYIQTFIPGRYGAYSDVLIDYAGFLTSSIFITTIILLIYIIKYLVTKIRSR